MALFVAHRSPFFDRVSGMRVCYNCRVSIALKVSDGNPVREEISE